MKKRIFFILSLTLLQVACDAFQRDVEIVDEVLQEEEKLVEEFKNGKPFKKTRIKNENAKQHRHLRP